MSEKIVQLNEEVIRGQLKELVRGSVEETLNELLEAEAEKLTQAARYERNEQRQGYRSGHYSRNLTTTSGDVTLKVPKLKGISFKTVIIERYRRRESSVEETLIEMCGGDWWSCTKSIPFWGWTACTTCSSRNSGVPASGSTARCGLPGSFRPDAGPIGSQPTPGTTIRPRPTF